MAIEKFSTLLPSVGQGKRIMKSKLLTALGGTGVLAPFPQNPERILERKILLQNTFIWNPSSPVVTNGLLNSLTAYWNMNEAGGTTRNDSTANGLNLTDRNSNLSNETGKLSNAVLCSQTSVSNCLTHASNALFNTGVGISISYSCWVRNNGFIVAQGGIVCLGDNTAAGTAYFLWSDGTNLNWLVIEAGTLTSKQITLATAAGMGTTNYHHCAVGYDDVNKLIWAQFDGGTRSTLACNGMNPNTTVAFTIGNFASFINPEQCGVDEVGYWRRVLTTTDVANLFNGGAALPFSSFTN